jgi:membrane fusion protein (multidrug efflux system)
MRLFRVPCQLRLAFVIAWPLRPRRRCAANGRRRSRRSVTTTQVRSSPGATRCSRFGNVQAHESITVTAKVSETVQQVHFESGETVAEGAPLIT